ncbi:MAG TPA: type II toxin-antitoxin system HicB family antitoxin, partial [Candidatus Thermoplasmatota archaeon]|nr:type II toxin-antitoxin system HicB family antitoxin [Candidatus Thermoplasmatota archaeon]
ATWLMEAINTKVVDSLDVEFDVVLERNPKTGVWVADVPGVPGAYSQGKSRDEAVAHVREALRLVIATDGIRRPPVIEFAKIRIEA